jgi:hypothetical protein
MAVVFISPKKKQRVFFIGITATFLLVLVSITFFVFMSQPQQVAQELGFNKRKVNINFNALDSDQFKELLPFNEMQRQFTYTAENENGDVESGFISAISIEEARKILESIDLIIQDIKEAEIGRENPFTPYYQLMFSSGGTAE